MGDSEPRRSSHQPERPWLERRQGESAQQWNHRTNHTCYSCGVYIADLQALDAHEAQHR